MTTGVDTLTNPRLDSYTSLALLFAGLVAYPALYCSGIMGRIIAPIFTENSRPHWWYFRLANARWIALSGCWLPLCRFGHILVSREPEGQATGLVAWRGEDTAAVCSGPGRSGLPASTIATGCAA